MADELYLRAVSDLWDLSRKSMEYREEVLREAARRVAKHPEECTDLQSFKGWCIELRYLMQMIDRADEAFAVSPTSH